MVTKIIIIAMFLTGLVWWLFGSMTKAALAKLRIQPNYAQMVKFNKFNEISGIVGLAGIIEAIFLVIWIIVIS